MIKFSAHLGYQFNEVPFKDRFELAHRYGYRDVEFPNPYVFEKEEVAELLAKYSLNLVQFGTPQGQPGEKGFAAMPQRSAEFRASVDEAVRYARHLHCRMVHPMAGCDSINNRAQWTSYLENIRLCAEIFADNGITVLLEVMSLPTVKGYFLHSFELFTALRNEIPEENIGLLFDTWHAKIIYDDVMHPLIKFWDAIEHIQISDHPGRHEPGTGTINFAHLFQLLEEKNYRGFVGCEYHPLKSTAESLNFMKLFQKENV